MKKSLKNLSEIVAISAGIILSNGCGSDDPVTYNPDNNNQPYKAITVDSIPFQVENSRVIIKGRLKSVGPDNVALEDRSGCAIVSRSSYYGYSGDWDSLAPILKSHISQPRDTNKIFEEVVQIYGVINTTKNMEMRYVSIGPEFYEVYK